MSSIPSINLIFSVLSICPHQILTYSSHSSGQGPREKRFLEGGKIQVDGFFGYSDSKHDEIERYFREQNWRVIKAELKYLKHLQGHKQWQVKDPDYQFLQITRQILTQTCPVEEVSDMLIRAVARIFRYVLADRREPNLYGLTITEPSKKDNIMEILRVCLNDSVPYNFTKEYRPEKCHPPYKGMIPVEEPAVTTPVPGAPTPAPTTPAGQRRRRAPGDPTEAPKKQDNETKGPPETKLCTCRKTYTGVQLNETINNTCVGLDKELAWDSRERDFLSETIWKMFQFTHYHCAKYFAADGSGLSVFHERVERFFHADIILRWANPGPTGKKLWEYYFFAYDLPSFLRGLDTCVCSAKRHSEYTQPMKRPSIPTFRKKRQADKVFGGDMVFEFEDKPDEEIEIFLD